MSNDEPTPPQDLSYQAALDELHTLVDELDEGRIDVDTLGERFQRAIAIVEELDGRILRTKEQVDQLAPRLEELAKNE